MDHIRLAIDTLTQGPYGLGRCDGKVILVPGTAPGDIADVRIIEDRKRYALGQLVALKESGHARTTPPCPYAGRCGGCSWQHVDYETQLQSKQSNVADALARVAKLHEFQMLPVLRGSEPYHYRRRIRLHRGGAAGLGFHRMLSHEIVPVENCRIAEPAINTHIPLAGQWLQALTTHVTSIEILHSHHEQVILVGRADGAFHQTDERTCRELCAGHADLAGMVLSGPTWRYHWGQDQIPYSVGDDLNLRIDADAFSQVNTQGNELLLTELMRWANFREQDRVLELYSGAGNLTLPIARQARAVVAIEAHPGLVRNGKRNSRRNALNNVEWRCQKAHLGLIDLVEAHDRFQTIVMNPPRSGAKDVIRNVTRLGAEKIFYVACDPATMSTLR